MHNCYFKFNDVARDNVVLSSEIEYNILSSHFTLYCCNNGGTEAWKYAGYVCC